MASLVFNKPNVSDAIKVLLLLYNFILKPFFNKILEIFKLLSITFKVNFKKTPNIN